MFCFILFTQHWKVISECFTYKIWTKTSKATPSGNLMPTHLDVFVGLEFTDVLLQEQQIQREIIPLAIRGGQNAHSGQQLVDFQEVGIPMAEEGAQTGVDHHRNECNKHDQVDEAGNKINKMV